MTIQLRGSSDDKILHVALQRYVSSFTLKHLHSNSIAVSIRFLILTGTTLTANLQKTIDN